jgi:tetratricopeptide (TPR) repeat protein
MDFPIFRIVFLWLVLAGISSLAIAAEWQDYVEFRDTVKSGTVPEPLVAQGKIVIRARTADEKAKVSADLELVYANAPGLFRRAAAQGPVPIYRIINQRNSFGGHGALWLSYFGAPVVAHELTHVADAEHKIVRSKEFGELVVPRMTRVRNAMADAGYTDFFSKEAEQQDHLFYPEGLPSFYAAWTVQEALAEFARAAVTGPGEMLHPEILDFMTDRLLDGSPEPDPSVALYREGKRLRLSGDAKAAADLLAQAVAIDSAFAEAYIELGQTRSSLGMQKEAIDDFSKALGLMPEYDWLYHVPLYQRGVAYALLGEWENTLADWTQVKSIKPDRRNIDLDIQKAEFLMKSQSKKTAQ